MVVHAAILAQTVQASHLQSLITAIAEHRFGFTDAV
jgi:hypothetical protein